MFSAQMLFYSYVVETRGPCYVVVVIYFSSSAVCDMHTGLKG